MKTENVVVKFKRQTFAIIIIHLGLRTIFLIVFYFLCLCENAKTSGNTEMNKAPYEIIIYAIIASVLSLDIKLL